MPTRLTAVLKTFWPLLLGYLLVISNGISFYLTQLLGSWTWQPPAWLHGLGRQFGEYRQWLRLNPKRGWLFGCVLLLVATGGGLGVWWYAHLPKPVLTHYQVTPPTATSYDEQGHPEPEPLQIVFDEPVAPVEKIGKTLHEGVALSPQLEGQWSWADDKTLNFYPKTDWAIGTDYTVKFSDSGFLAPTITLAQDSLQFRSPPFTAEITQAEFYQDPMQPTQKQLVATVSFSHPVDSADFADKVQLTLADGLDFLNATAPPVTISYDAYKLHAYLHSGVLAVPKENTTLKLSLQKGIRSNLGGNATADTLNRDVVIPGLYRLNFDSISMTLIDNERFEPEQVLLINATAPISTDMLKSKLHVWLLPEYPPNASEEEREEPYVWSTGKVTSAVAALAEPVAITAQATEKDYETLHGFKFSAPVGRSVLVKIDSGAQAFGGYLARQDSWATVTVQPYPQAVKWLSQGSLLSLTGERKLAYMSRGLDGVKIDIGRVLPKQLHHLVDQNSGGFAQPDLGDHALDTLVEHFEEKRPVDDPGFGKPSYDSLDVGQYLQNNASSYRGVFMVKVQAYNPDNPNETSDVPPDVRFVLVTDLGIIAKNSVGGGQDVFVQSIASGQPISDARVDVVGINGQTVFSQITDATGRVNFPPLKELEREKTPLMYMVSYDDDLSFLPINREDRKLDLSRFDVGGSDNAVSPKQLSVFAFTDRGLYRPGETAHIGFITRTADWQGRLAGLPLEMEIIDPRGLSVLNKRVNLPASGFDSIDFTSQDSSATGEYSAGFYLISNNRRSQQIGSVDFKVRDFEPDRMKVKLQLSGQAVTGWLQPQAVQARINAMQLFGSPAATRRVEAEMVLSPALPAFAAYKDYSFRNQFKPIESFKETLTATATDANGDAALNLDLQRFASATYQLYVSGKVFEAAGGRSVAAEATALVSAAPYLVGVKADGDLKFIPRNASRSSHWLAVAPDLKAIAVGDLTLQLVARQYVSVLVKQDDGTYRYQSRPKETVRDSQPYVLPATGADIALNTSEPGDFAWVLKDTAGNELNRVEYSVTGQANISRSLERNAELQLTLDKNEYAPGDSIAINIRAPYVGSGLITIERDRVYQHVWFKTDTTSSVQYITLPEDFEGNGYVSVQFVRDANSDEIFMSPLSYGVIPFAVSLETRKELLFFSADKTIKPGQTLAISLKSESPSRAVVFAVDEGILQVARYQAPDPLGFFFQKRALQVDTTQILDLILPEFQKLLDAAAPGGDGDEDQTGRHLNPFKKKHQPPVAWWSGIIDVDENGQVLHYAVPESFNGKLHLFVVAVNAGRIGVYESLTEVRGDIILSPNLPTAVSPGDEFKISVGVFNNSPSTDPAKQLVSVSLQTPPGLQAVSANQLSLPIAPQQEGIAEFTVKAGDYLGPADLRLLANANGKDSALSESISIRPPIPFSTQLTLGRFDGSAKTLTPTRQLYLQHRDVTAGIALSPLIWTQGLNDYLNGYEHACTEQLVSKAMPALVFNQDHHNAGLALGQALQILQARQNDEGGFGLWAASLQVEPLTSVYAVHFLIEAKERGMAVSSDMLANANRWLEQVAATDSQGLDGIRNRAYAIYLLTRQGIVTSTYLATLQQDLDSHYREQWPKDLTAAYIAASYQLLQQDTLAANIIKAVPWSGTPDTAATDDYSYYDPLIHDAQLLYLRSKHFPTTLQGVPEPVITRMAESISDNLYNTLSAAYLILGLDAYALANADDNSQLAIAETDAGQPAQTLPLIGSRTKTAAISAGATQVTFSKNGSLPAFYLLSENGFDHQALPAKTQGLEIAREFTNLDGKPITHVKIGEEFLVKLNIRSTERDKASAIALVDLLPGGIEPVLNAKPEADASEEDNAATEEENPESGGSEAETEAAGDTAASTWQAPLGESKGSDWRPEYVDIREDRVILYGTVGRSIGTFIYRVRATNAGHYTVPAPFAEGMYDRKLQARGTAGELLVETP